MSVPLLTDNELEVLNGAAAGETYADTARRIFLTRKSVSNVATRVMRKLGAKTMPQAVLLACQAGLLDGRPRSQRHGDHTGYTNHQKRGEEACDACKAGEAAYQVERRRKRRQVRVYAHDGGPSVRECAEADDRWWGGEKAGE